MMKKAILFILCLMPFTVQAADVTPAPVPGAAYTGGQVTNPDGATFTDGISVDNIIVGLPLPEFLDPETLYAVTTNEDFTLLSGSAINVSNNVDVADNSYLVLSAATGSGIQSIDISLNEVSASGDFTIKNANTLSITGTVNVTGNFWVTDYSDPAFLPGVTVGANVGATNMNVGSINASDGGNVLISVGEALQFNNLSNSGSGTVMIAADTITVGNSSGGINGYIQNLSGAGNMAISAANNINVTGSITNAGSAMNVTTGGDLIVSGTMSNSADMVINAVNLTVIGGNAETASFVNSGNLTINTSNTTNLAFGLDLSGMDITNSFKLTTGSLVFGSGVTADGWLNTFSNKLNSFTLNITNGSFDIESAVINGLINDDAQNPSYNENANMSLTAQAFQANSITNYGNTLTMEATNTGGAGIVIANGVEGVDGSTTNISSASVLNINGLVSNAGTMNLNGTNVSLENVINNGGTFNIDAPTSEIGSIFVSGNITNESGNTYINAKDINITGSLINNSGVTTIEGSDTAGTDLQIGYIDVNDGIVNIDALIGSVAVNSAVNVEKGTMNINSSTYSFTAQKSITIAGDVTVGSVTDVPGNGDVYINASGTQNFVMSSTAGQLNISGGINATQEGVPCSATFGANNIIVGGDINAVGSNNTLIFGNSSLQSLTLTGSMSATEGATIKLVADDVDVGSLNVDEISTLVVSGSQITATNGAIKIGGGIWFDGAAIKPTSGLIVDDIIVSGETYSTNTLTLYTNNNINIAGSVDLGAANTLNITANNSETLIGGDLNVSGILNVVGNTIQAGNVINAGTTTLTSQDNIAIGNVNVNSGTVNMNVSGNAIPNISMGSLNVNAGSFVNINSSSAANIAASGSVTVNGDVVQGIKGGALNLLAGSTTFAGTSFNVTGNYFANAGTALLDFADSVNITGDINVNAVSSLTVNAETITANDIDNAGILLMNSDNGINLSLINNTGVLSLDSGIGVTSVNSFVTGNLGTITLKGAGLVSDGEFTVPSAILYQNYANALPAGAVNVLSNNYTITANKFNVSGINQISGAMHVNTSSVNVIGDIIASNLRFTKNPSDTWMVATVGGNVSGGVDFWGIKQLDIAGNYIFNDNSEIWAAVMPYNETCIGNTSNRNYWATIEETPDNKVGEITNPENAAPLISVGKNFISNVTSIYNPAGAEPQVGITLYDVVDQGTAIWLLHAENGIKVEDAFSKLRNLDVQFCNADGSICISYLDTLNTAGFGQYNGTDESLPIYISERDTDDDGNADSLYIVFDPNFGGPVRIFPIQPVVGETIPHTNGEYISAGAIDDLIAGQLWNNKFYNDAPIEIIPQIFKDTNLSQMANELYNRLEYYNMTGGREPLARFSRLFQARELEQITSMIALNEHTTFRDFEDRMFDEFIWNRNRNLNKAWMDLDVGIFNYTEADGIDADGWRFNLSGGFDWQFSETMILGVTARLSNSFSDTYDSINLSYMPGQVFYGSTDIDVNYFNIGVGGYMLKTFDKKHRLYGNAFLDINLLDVNRNQTFVENIKGSGTGFSLISEWGWLHDWLNQYIVGNVYARAGYNFGFDITESAGGQDYMNLESNGYMILTPGYSLVAQKRIYPSSWLQVRPYISIGVEYDILGTPDYAKYKFALANSYTNYDIDIDPLWANIGGGVEVLSVNGVQVGLDYRYQYNDTIQLHNIKISGSYRF